jgi:uncharacterized iron-regulated membrane protein
MTFRAVHKKVALIVLPVLAVSALTGLVFRIGRQWFGMTEATGLTVRAIHEGKYLGEALNPIYVLVAGLGLLMLIGTGITMVRRRRGAVPSRRRARPLHRLVAIAVALPLTASAVTGIGFRLSQSWFGWTKEQAQWLLDIHQGTLLFGSDYRAYYVLFIGVGLLTLVVTGARMLGLLGRR